MLPAIEVLVEATYGDDLLARQAAAVVLARIAPAHPRMLEISQSAENASYGQAHTSLLVHGTGVNLFPTRGPHWWQPDGDFHSYIQQQVCRDLYDKPDFFEWSGFYSDHDRALGGAKLAAWARNHGIKRVNTLIAHSHGCNAAIMAGYNGLEVERLVLLSWPVHLSKYMPSTGRCGRIISIRTKLDLVLLLDRAGQYCRNPDIEEHILPIWFSHSATHEPEVWREHNLAAKL
jgi:hypothetical protein